jgi:hypothetical protein
VSDHLPNRPSRPSYRPLVLGLAVALAGDALAAERATVHDPLAGFIAASDAGRWGRHLAPDAFAPFVEALRARIGARITATPLDRAPSVRSVGNCNDSGSGSFREAVENAVDGDTVDMTHLTCSTISLSSGVVAHANNLTVHGPGPQLTIDAGHHGPAMFAYGSGLLSISGVSMTNGAYGLGGCLVSVGSIALANVAMSDCTSIGYGSAPGYSDGGAVFAAVDLTVTSSTFSNNDAYDSSFSGRRAYGGALFAHGNMTITASTLRSNAATAGGNYAGGGGALSAGIMTIDNSTLSLNSALDVGGNYALGGGAIGAGGIVVGGSTIEGNASSLGGGLSGGGASTAFIVVNSTLTANDATVGGGIIALAPLSLFNSTVAFNYAGGGVAGGGVVIAAGATLQSSIVANNYAGAGCTERCRPDGGSNGIDLSANGNPVTIAGANNLVINIDPAMTLPPGTLRVDPKLAPFLENNGGPTQTLALQSGSPAIGAGNNVEGLSTDQRGGGYARTSGNGTDIGAFEVQSGGGGDLIFRSGFDPS